MISKSYCYESAGGVATCFGCGALIPKGVIAYCSGMYDWCPICAPRVPGHTAALDQFNLELWERWRKEDAERGLAAS